MDENKALEELAVIHQELNRIAWSIIKAGFMVYIGLIVNGSRIK